MECSKQEVRVAKATAVLGHFKSHNIQKGESDATKGRSFLSCTIVSPRFPPGARAQTRKRVCLSSRHLCVSSVALSPSIPPVRPSAPCTCTFLVSSQRAASGAALVSCPVVRVGIYNSFTARSLRFDYLTRTFLSWFFCPSLINNPVECRHTWNIG